MDKLDIRFEQFNIGTPIPIDSNEKKRIEDSLNSLYKDLIIDINNHNGYIRIIVDSNGKPNMNAQPINCPDYIWTAIEKINKSIL